MRQGAAGGGKNSAVDGMRLKPGVEKVVGKMCVNGEKDVGKM